jgi:hypothetical protein
MASGPRQFFFIAPPLSDRASVHDCHINELLRGMSLGATRAGRLVLRVSPSDNLAMLLQVHPEHVHFTLIVLGQPNFVGTVKVQFGASRAPSPASRTRGNHEVPRVPLRSASDSCAVLLDLPAAAVVPPHRGRPVRQ